MGRRISMATRAELLDVVSDRYCAGDRRQRARLLDEFVSVSGYHRKHAIRLLISGPSGKRRMDRPPPLEPAGLEAGAPICSSR